MVSEKTILDTVETTLKAKISGFKQGIETIKTFPHSDQIINKIEFTITELQNVLDSINRMKE
jgi:hypothetical protein